MSLKLATTFLVVSLATGAACGPATPGAAKRIEPVYDRNGKLTLLKYDSNGDGKPDTWSYMDGARIVRIEMDQDGDGTIDRWEYYNRDQKLEKIGSSRANDGKEDSWSYAGTDGKVERVEISTRRDGKITRVEHYDHGQLVAAEEAPSADAAIDKWETYVDGRLVAVSFDTTHRGRADRRVVYAADGSARLEVDSAGAGVFAVVKNAHAR
jgi:hypothetical protein